MKFRNALIIACMLAGGGVNTVLANHTVASSIPIYFPIKGIDIRDDNTGTFNGTWSADGNTKTVTRATASDLSNFAGGFDLIIWPLSAITWIDGTPLNLTKNDVSVRVESNNKYIHFDNYSKFQDETLFGAGFWFGTVKTINTTTGDTTPIPDVVKSNIALLNGTYQIYISFKYKGNTYTCKKTLIIAY